MVREPTCAMTGLRASWECRHVRDRRVTPPAFWPMYPACEPSCWSRDAGQTAALRRRLRSPGPPDPPRRRNPPPAHPAVPSLPPTPATPPPCPPPPPPPPPP